MPSMTAGQILVKCLQSASVKRVSGVIGTSLLGLFDALYDARDSLRYISCRHEQVAASMADVEGRLTGRPGVAVVHAGPGALNAMISVANAAKDASPMILITGAVKRKLRGTGGMLEVDHRTAFKPFCKAVFTVETADDMASAVAKAFSLSLKGDKGPCVIEVPEDLWFEKTEAPSQFGSIVPPAPQVVDAIKVKEILSALKNARLPLMLSGGGVAYSGSHKVLVKLAERLGCPVITTGNGRGTIPEDHPLCLGRVGFGGSSIVADKALKTADMVLCLGCSLSDVTTYEFTWLPSGRVVAITLEDIPAERLSYMDEVITCDVADFLEKACQVIDDNNMPIKNTWDDILAESRKEWRDMVSTNLKEGKTLRPGLVCQKLARLIPDDTIISVGSGMHVLYPMVFIPSTRPLSYLSSGNFGAMGFGMAAGLAAKLIYPKKTVISILGDGDFMMTVQDMETAIRECIPLKIIVINDMSYRVLRMRQEIQLNGRVYGTLHGNPDFRSLAESFGAAGFCLEGPEDIDDVLQAFLSEDGPALIDVKADPEDIPPTNLEAALGMSIF